MSTPQPPEKPPIHWLLQEAIEGTWISSEERRWREFSDVVELNPGFVIHQTRGPIHTLRLGLQGQDVISVLTPPQPTFAFAFDRFAQGMRLHPGELTEFWLYSVYGYILGDEVACVRIYPTQEVEYLLLPRPVSFPW